MLITDYPIFHKQGSFTSSRFMLDDNYNIVGCNPEGKEMLGGNVNMAFNELGHDETQKGILAAFFTELDEKGNSRCLCILSDRENRPRLTDLRGTKETEGGYEIFMWDVPDLEDDYSYIRNNMWKYRTMISLTSRIFYDYDLDTQMISCYRYAAKKSIRVFYDSFEEFTRCLYRYGEESERNKTAMDQLIDQLKSGASSVDITVRSGIFHNSHEVETLEFRASYDDMYGHHMMYGLVNVLSESKEELPYYLTRAGLDSVTGLLSKRSLIEYSEDIFRNPANCNRPHYMVLLDIDDFKSINDNYGHIVGDQVILLLSRVLSDVVREDGIVGRYGGDEFYILTNRISEEEDLRILLRSIRGSLEARAREELNIEKLTLSMGVSRYPDNGRSFNDLLQLSDKSLYIAKEKGKNRYIIYRPDMHEKINVGADRRGISSYDEQAKAINTVVRDLFVSGRSAIETAIPTLVKGFDLDNLDIYCGDELKKAYSGGKYGSNLEASIFTGNKKHMDEFDKNGLYVLNNYNNIRKSNEEMFEYLSDKRCMSLIQLALPTPEEPKYFASFTMQNRIHKWSEAEISNLTLFGTLVYEILQRDPE